MGNKTSVTVIHRRAIFGAGANYRPASAPNHLPLLALPLASSDKKRKWERDRASDRLRQRKWMERRDGLVAGNERAERRKEGRTEGEARKDVFQEEGREGESTGREGGCNMAKEIDDEQDSRVERKRNEQTRWKNLSPASTPLTPRC